MEFIDSSDILSKDLIGTPTLTSNDNEDLDQNTSTDKYLIAAWASVEGDWPGETYQDLVTVKFSEKRRRFSQLQFELFCQQYPAWHYL
jgi:hypothetical protein